MLVSLSIFSWYSQSSITFGYCIRGRLVSSYTQHNSSPRLSFYVIFVLQPFCTGMRRLTPVRGTSYELPALLLGPYKILPLNEFFLQKSSLGKLARSKIRKAFKDGLYDNLIIHDQGLINY
jgi:hypothetical protein